MAFRIDQLIFISITLFLIGSAQNDEGNACTSSGAVRLQGGANEREGRVELCVGGVWGTVCDDEWDSRDAQVVCNKLGLATNGAVAVADSFFGPGTGPIIFDAVECEGDESSLLLCPHNGLGSHDCTHEEDASVICQPANFSCADGELRLVGGAIPSEGRLEICFNNQFGTICDDGFGREDAEVACAQLGFSRSGAVGVVNGQVFGDGVGHIYLKNLQCTGSEPNITSCTHSRETVNCGHDEDAGVICRPLGRRKVCNDTDVRLVGGRVPSEGRVEFCYNDHWGTICDDLWDNRVNARVLCRELGFSSSNGVIVLSGNAFGPGEGTILLDNLRCRGTEPSIAVCLSNDYGVNNCARHEDVGVVCSNVNRTCTEGAVRLINGTGGREYEGRVEVCRNNIWGSVCDSEWSSEDAAVVCNYLGFPGTSLALPKSFYGRGVGPIWLSHVQCTGSESDLLDCPHSTDVMCNHDEVANVICTAPPNATLPSECENGNVRIVNGSVANEGRVELCFHGRWGTVCSDTWNSTDAGVVCTQLGYARQGALAIKTAYFGEGTGPIFLDRVDCKGNESALLECASKLELGLHNCGHDQDAGVICPVHDVGSQVCKDGDVRLSGGPSPSQGRVEVCINNRWGTVCFGSEIAWDSNDATVVCRQLGFNSNTTRGIPTVGVFGPGTGPIFLKNVGCFGTENNLLECFSSGVAFVTDCDHSQDVEVVCSEDVQCLENSVRLNPGGQTTPKHTSMGRVEICVDGAYSSVSSEGFGRNEAAAVCKQLGFLGEAFQETSGAFFGEGEEGVYALDLSPSGAITGPRRIQHSSHHNAAAGLICQGDIAPVCYPGDVRLVDGATPNEGRVEVCLGDQWGTVCDDSWDSNSATVVCRQLGLPTERADVKRFGGNKNLSILLDDVKCTGSEQNLFQCQRRNVGASDCSHSEDIGVTCGVRSEGTTASAEGASTAVLVAVLVPVLALVLLIAVIAMVTIAFIIYTKTRLKVSGLEDAPIISNGVKVHDSRSRDSESRNSESSSKRDSESPKPSSDCVSVETTEEQI